MSPPMTRSREAAVETWRGRRSVAGRDLLLGTSSQILTEAAFILAAAMLTCTNQTVIRRVLQRGPSIRNDRPSYRGAESAWIKQTFPPRHTNHRTRLPAGVRRTCCVRYCLCLAQYA